VMGESAARQKTSWELGTSIAQPLALSINIPQPAYGISNSVLQRKLTRPTRLKAVPLLNIIV
jgi:hypothetical protein